MLAGLTKKAGPMLKSSPIIIWTVWAAVLVLFISAAPARDLGQWEGADPLNTPVVQWADAADIPLCTAHVRY